MAVLGRRRIGVPRTSAERRRRRLVAGLVAAARLAAGLQRVRALALPRGARRARDRRPAAHRRAPSWSRSRARFARPRCSRAWRSPRAAACGIAFFAAAAYDWVWQLAGIAVVGVGMLGFALGALPPTRASAWGRSGVLRPAIALLAVAAIIPQFVVLAAGIAPAQQSGCRRRAGMRRGHGRRLSRPRPSSRGPPVRIASLVSSPRPRATTMRPRTGWTRRSAARDATGAFG